MLKKASEIFMKNTCSFKDFKIDKIELSKAGVEISIFHPMVILCDLFALIMHWMVSSF